MAAGHPVSALQVFEIDPHRFRIAPGHRRTKPSGRLQAKAAITTAPGSTSGKGAAQRRISTPSTCCNIQPWKRRRHQAAGTLHRSSIHRRTAMPCSAAVDGQAASRHLRHQSYPQRRKKMFPAGRWRMGEAKAGDKPGKGGRQIAQQTRVNGARLGNSSTIRTHFVPCRVDRLYEPPSG